MSQFLEYTIKSLRLTCIVLGSSYNEEDTNDADHHTQSSVPQPADGNEATPSCDITRRFLQYVTTVASPYLNGIGGRFSFHLV